jgi:hypothetical protein
MARRPSRSPHHRAQPSSHARLNRTMLVPMPRSHAEELSLQHHAAYESLRMKQGSEHGLATLLQMVVVTAFVDEARRHELRTDVIKVAEQAINEALERGRAGAGWFLDGQGEEIIAALIAWHDDQLRNAPLTTFAEALERLERLRDGRSYSRPSTHHASVR